MTESQDTRPTETAEPPASIYELANFVRRLAWTVTREDPENPVALNAIAYLRRKGLDGSILGLGNEP